MAARRRSERGMLLVSSLVLLVLITLIALSMFRSFGLQERVADRLREQQRALEAAESAEQYAEGWLTSGGYAATPVVCAAGPLNANAGQGQLCSNALATLVPDVARVPWAIAGAAGGEVGVDYTPTGPAAGAAGEGPALAPARFYIAVLGPSATGAGTVYQIDAVGYGATADAVAVIESTYRVAAGVRDLGTP